MKEPRELSAVVRVEGRWYWWEFRRGPIYIEDRQHVRFDRWRFAWTRQKHFRNAAGALMEAGYGSGWTIRMTSRRQWPWWLRWLGWFVGPQVTHGVVGLWGPGLPDPRYAAWARAYERAAERADWGTR